ncbi:hypothetical protein PMAYCL1PPCAC_14743, partial [Pristionchus mayeri]
RHFDALDRPFLKGSRLVLHDRGFVYIFSNLWLLLDQLIRIFRFGERLAGRGSILIIGIQMLVFLLIRGLLSLLLSLSLLLLFLILIVI